MTRRESWVLRGFAVWVTYEWVTLLWNVWHDHAKGQGLGFKLVHTVLAVITIAFAVVAWRAVSAIRSRHLLAPEPSPRRRDTEARRPGVTVRRQRPGRSTTVSDATQEMASAEPQAAGKPG